MAALRIGDVAFTPAPETMRALGLLGWVRATLDERLGLDGLAVRRSRDGRLVLSFPTRVDGQGRSHAIVWPLDDRVRRELEVRVFAALEAQEVLS